jgi:hypothetical protein
MNQSMQNNVRRSPESEPSAGGKSLTPEQAEARATEHVSSQVAQAGIRGAAAVALVSQAGNALRNRGLQASLLGMGVNALVQVHTERLVGVTLAQVADNVRGLAPAEIERIAKYVAAPTLRDSLELFVCMSNGLTLSGFQGLFSNFGPIAKFHDLEAQSAATLRVAAPSFSMTPSMQDGVAGLTLQEGQRTGFYPLRALLRESDGVLKLAENPQAQIIGSLISCQQRGLLLAILCYAAGVPGLLNSRHTEGKLKACDSSWTPEGTRQVAELYNALDEKWRPTYREGIHQALLGT